MVESPLWADAQKKAGQAAGAFRELFRRRHVRALSFLIVMYGVWNLVAGTYGFFFPYILEAVGNTSDRANYTLQAIWFLSTAIAVGAIYMPRIDRVGGRSMLIWASVLQVLGFVPFVFFEVTFLTALINVVLFGVGAGIGQQSLFQLWSGEMFPTLLRSTAQGFMFGVVRVALGGWSLLLPTVTQAGFRTLAIVLALMLIVSGVVGIAMAPRGTSRDLEEDEGSDRFARGDDRALWSEPSSQS
jgi:inositol transporter-like SP family MFS transporter